MVRDWLGILPYQNERNLHSGEEWNLQKNNYERKEKERKKKQRNILICGMQDVLENKEIQTETLRKNK